MNTQIYDVLPGQPFGRGTASSTISADPNKRCSISGGTSGSPNLTVKADGNYTNFANGDLVVTHQATEPQEASAVNWEVNQIASGGGTANIVLENNMGRTYTDSYVQHGKAVKSQLVKVIEYNNLTMNSFTGYAWRSPEHYTYGYGGIVVVAVKNTLTINGTPNLNAKNGWASTQDGNGLIGATWYTHSSVVGGGFRPGWNSTDGSSAGKGEGNFLLTYEGYESEGVEINGNGAGGGRNIGDTPGGGGGNGTAGANGEFGFYGRGGHVVGNSALTSMYFGGGGGGGRQDATDTAGSGGGGGGIFIIWARNIVMSGGLQAKGGIGGNGTGTADGGSGAGGSILINCQNGAFGTNKILATGGASTDKGGAGGTGRVRINYGGGITGTTNPTASTAQDGKLTVAQGAFIMNMI